MITLKYFGDHMRELREMLWTSSCSGRGDLLLVSSNNVKVIVIVIAIVSVSAIAIAIAIDILILILITLIIIR